MNSLIKNSVFLVLLSGFVIISNSQTGKGIVSIETNRDSSVIFLNQKLLGIGKAKVMLEPGSYVIRVKENDNNNDWDSNILYMAISVKQCDSIVVPFLFSNEKYLQTNPQDVAVYSGDTLVGYTPLYLSSGFNSLQLNKPGYEGKTISFSDFKSDQPVSLNFIGEIKSKSFYKKDLFKYLVAGIVVLGGTSAYFKLKADNRFDAYKITGEQDLLDQTHKYDLISGILFTALQINFGTLIYFLFSD